MLRASSGLLALTFQFTHPGRGATERSAVPIGRAEVSIHAPREGCDPDRSPVKVLALLFQFTHPGRGATSCNTFDISLHHLFQFTHPGRGATHLPQPNFFQPAFQFTHPGRGATSGKRTDSTATSSFNSRTPGGVRLDSFN